MARLSLVWLSSLMFLVGCSTGDSDGPQKTAADHGVDQRATSTDSGVSKDVGPTYYDTAVVRPSDEGGMADQLVADLGPQTDSMALDSTQGKDVTVVDGMTADYRVVVDTTPAADRAFGTKNCMGLKECAEIQNCTTVACIDDCKALGCASAQKKATELRACALAQCRVICLAAYGTDCDACVADKCKTLLDACVADQC